ncbi:MAG TPA: efflux RND transporter periplasmic adaptor subunit [Methylophilus sp.]|nr:efflux RND transporter periplasmic adaptor subunit [Methylophilus sp.]HQQ33254.1 efflux RND transporter periplasmic adaptor subunit [Methylophilus sp.]
MDKFISLKQVGSYFIFALVAATLLGCNKPTENKAPEKAVDKPLRSMVVTAGSMVTGNQYDGTVEAVRQTNLAAQVSGTIITLNVAAGDKVKKSQLLVRLDSQAANQAVAASGAQLASARAQLELARQEYERQKQLYEKNYISKGALDHAEAALKSATAQVNAQAAQTGVASAQTSFHSLKAPYDGVVSDVPTTLGDMATPGKVLVTMYDPSQLRVAVDIPQSLAKVLDTQVTSNVTIQMNGQDLATPTSIQLLPAADATTHTRTVWLNLPASPNVVPGTNTSVRFAADIGKTQTAANVTIPSSAIIKRAETTSVYVITKDNQPMLRQLRLGATHGNQVEVLSGLTTGERIALDPQVAASVE